MSRKVFRIEGTKVRRMLRHDEVNHP